MKGLKCLFFFKQIKTEYNGNSKLLICLLYEEIAKKATKGILV